jgi:quinol monooxygenase YgiN
MFEEGKIYTNGIWQVKAGREENFKSLWKEFAEDGIKNRNTLEAILLREYDNPKNFVSIGIWENLESIKKWQNSPEFKSYIYKFNELCDSRQIKSLKSGDTIKSCGLI